MNKLNKNQFTLLALGADYTESLYYVLLDSLAVTAVSLLPPLKKRWLAYQFGCSEEQLFEFLRSTKHTVDKPIAVLTQI